MYFSFSLLFSYILSIGSNGTSITTPFIRPSSDMQSLLSCLSDSAIETLLLYPSPTVISTAQGTIIQSCLSADLQPSQRSVIIQSVNISLVFELNFRLFRPMIERTRHHSRNFGHRALPNSSLANHLHLWRLLTYNRDHSNAASAPSGHVVHNKPDLRHHCSYDMKSSHELSAAKPLSTLLRYEPSLSSPALHYAVPCISRLPQLPRYICLAICFLISIG